MLEKFVVKLLAPELNVEFSEKDQTHFNEQLNLIVIGKDFNSDGEEFLAHIERAHFYEKVGSFSLRFWTLLHEIGHYMTCSISEDEIESYTDYMLYHINSENKTYFDKPREWLATDWAVGYVVAHPVLSYLFNKFVEKNSNRVVRVK